MDSDEKEGEDIRSEIKAITPSDEDLLEFSSPLPAEFYADIWTEQPPSNPR